MNWTESYADTHPLEPNAYLEKRYLYLSLKTGVTGALTLIRRVGLGDSCWTDKTKSMKLVYKALQPRALSSNGDNDTKYLFSSRKRMETFKKITLC